MATRKQRTADFDTLRDHALALPGAKEEHPWGHSAIKVNGKTFVFLSNEGGLSVSTKLPHSNEAALHFPFAEPTHYGLGKSGWVTSSFEPSAPKPPVEILKAWIVESYRAIAPRKLIKEFDQEISRHVKMPEKKATKKLRVGAGAPKRVKARHSRS